MGIRQKHYFFVTTFTLEASLLDVSNALSDYLSWSKWWKGLKQVKAEKILGIIPNGIHCTIGFPLYSLKLTLTPLEVVALKKLVFTVDGDLEGKGIFLLTTQQDQTTIRFEWDVKTTKPWMNIVEPIGRPFFVFGHNRIMKWFGEGLAKYLETDMSFFSSRAE